MISAELSLRDFGVLERASAMTGGGEGGEYVTGVRFRFSAGQVVEARLVEETCELEVVVDVHESESDFDIKLSVLDRCVGRAVSEIWWMENSRGYLDGLQIQFWNEQMEGEPVLALLVAQNAEIEVVLLGAKG